MSVSSPSVQCKVATRTDPRWRVRIPVSTQARLQRTFALLKYKEPGLTWAKLLSRWEATAGKNVRYRLRLAGHDPEKIMADAGLAEPAPDFEAVPEFGQRVTVNRGSRKGKPKKL